MGSKTMKEQ